MKTTRHHSTEWAQLVECGWITVDIDAHTGIALMWYAGAPTLLAYEVQATGHERWALIGEERLS